MLGLLKPGSYSGHGLWVGVDKRCCSIQGPIWALCAWRLRPIVSSCSVCRSSSETPHGRNLFLPFHCGGVSLGGDGFVLLCDGIAGSSVFGGMGQKVLVFPHMSVQVQNKVYVLHICTPIMKSTHFKSGAHPFSWSWRRSLLVCAALPPSSLSVRTLWPWRGWSSARLLHGRGTAAIIVSRRRIDCQYFFRTGWGRSADQNQSPLHASL